MNLKRVIEFSTRKLQGGQEIMVLLKSEMRAIPSVQNVKGALKP